MIYYVNCNAAPNGDGSKQRRKTRGYGARFMLARRYLHQSDAFPKKAA